MASIYELSELFRGYVPAVIFAVVCAVSILLFLREKKKQYLAFTIGFAVLAVGWVAVPRLTSYLHLQVILAQDIWLWIWAYLAYTLFYIIPALLILTGFIFMYKEHKQAE